VEPLSRGVGPGRRLDVELCVRREQFRPGRRWGGAHSVFAPAIQTNSALQPEVERISCLGHHSTMALESHASDPRQPLAILDATIPQGRLALLVPSK